MIELSDVDDLFAFGKLDFVSRVLDLWGVGHARSILAATAEDVRASGGAPSVPMALRYGDRARVVLAFNRPCAAPDGGSWR
jgi:hypothetical protein